MKKTILIYTAYTLPHLGGIEKYVHNLSEELVKHNYEIIIVSTNYTFKKEYSHESDHILYLKLPIYHFWTNRYPIIRRNKTYHKIIDILDMHHIDAIIVNTRFHLTSLEGARYGHKRNIPVFLIEHGSQHLTVDNKFLDFLGEIYEHRLTSIVKKYVNQYYGVSSEACKWQKHFKIDSNGVWYNSINDFSQQMTLSKNDKNIHILYAGRILKQKGVQELIDAFIKINQKYPHTILTVAGDGNLLPYLKDNYKNDHIIFTGKLDFSDLIKYYAQTDIFVYTPIWPEGLPTSILEAGLMQCATIGSSQGGIKEIIDDQKTGLLINQINELDEALETLVTNKDLRISLAENLNQKIKKDFLWTKTAEKVIHDIETYIEKNKQCSN